MKHVLKLLRFLNPFLIFRVIGYTIFRLRNWRRGRFKKMDYVLFRVPDSMPSLPEDRRFIQRVFLGTPSMSLREFDESLQWVADDPRTKGVILRFGTLDMASGDLHALRDSIQRFKDCGKRVICYAQLYDTATYFVACAADEILVQPAGQLFTLGLQQQVVYQKDALDFLGVKIEPIAITPYKSAYETLSQQTASPEARAQRDWLLNSRYEILLDAITSGRGLSRDDAKAFIDGAPYIAEEAHEQGFVDGVINEDFYANHLGVDHIAPWDLARKKLLLKRKKRLRKKIAVLPIKGVIVSGESVTPPAQPPVNVPVVGEERAGDETIVKQARRLMNDDEVAAVVVYVDSRGGSAAASEAMASTLEQLAQKCPVIAYMHNYAASGGYYVTTAAHYIVAQPGTITGSIGVISAKPSTVDLYNKLKLNRIELTRGKNADLLSDALPLTDDHRAALRRGVESLYEVFLHRVATARKMDKEEVDKIGGGRVWTGQQAFQRKLVDKLGGMDVALAKAREMANLPEETPVEVVQTEDKRSLPQQAAAAASDPLAWVRYVETGIKTLYNGHAQMFMPFTLEE